MFERKWESALGIILGLAAGCLIASIRDLLVKEWMPVIAVATFFLLLVLARDPERLSLFLFLVTPPFAMHGFLLKLDPLHGGGALGIYLVAADLPLITLYGLWFFDWIKKRSSRPYRPSRLILWFLPFLVLGGLSIIYSIRPLWAMCEWLRWVKFLLILIYAVKRLRPRDITWCLSALAVSVLLQSTLAILQSVTHSNLGLDRLGIFGAGGKEELTQELAGGEILYRGVGLTGHPELLASYLLILLPIFALLVVVERRKLFLTLWSGTLVVGLGGLISTMSRAAWVSFLIASTIGFICAVSQSVIHVKKAIMLSMVVLLTAGVLTLSFSSLIIKRFESDFSASWELRVQLNKTALAIAGDHPVGGVGLNNYTLVYPDYDPAFADQMLAMDDMLTVVHNVYLLILAEAGALGLAAFLAFYLGVFLRTASNLKRMSRFSRALALGILCGILGAMLCDLTEISLIFEVTMYTIPFLVGMLEVLAQAGYGSASLEASAASGRLTLQLQS